MTNILPFPALHAAHGGIWLAPPDGTTESIGRGTAIARAAETTLIMLNGEPARLSPPVTALEQPGSCLPARRNARASGRFGEQVKGERSMSRTVTALYDTRAEAEVARQRLASAVDLGSARIIDRPGGLDELHMSADDRHVYQEGIRRGAFVLTAEVRGHEDPAKIIRIIEESASLDLDAQREQWRGEGWSAPPSSPPGVVTSGLRVPDGRREAGLGGGRVRFYLWENPSDARMEAREDRSGAERRPLAQPQGVHHGGPIGERSAVQQDLALGAVPAPDRPPVAASLADETERHLARSGPIQPSAGEVIGSAIAGALLGGAVGAALPFILAEAADTARRNPNPRRSRSVQTTVPLSEDGRVRMIRS